MLPPTLRKQDWEGTLNALLREMVESEQITEAPEDTSLTGRFNDLLEEFCAHRQQAMDRDELLMGRPWVNEEEAQVYFRIKDLEAHLLRSNFKGLSTAKIAQRLRELGGEPISLFIKNRTVRCWHMPAFAKQDAPFESPEQKKGSPF